MTLYGEARSGWKVDGNRFEVSAVVPPNTRATVHLPGARLGDVREGNALLNSTLGVTRSTQTGETVLVEVGSGSYVFAYDAPGLAARVRAGASR
jgi:alpha-L-rhamnosidase